MDDSSHVFGLHGPAKIKSESNANPFLLTMDESNSSTAGVGYHADHHHSGNGTKRKPSSNDDDEDEDDEDEEDYAAMSAEGFPTDLGVGAGPGTSLLSLGGSSNQRNNVPKPMPANGKKTKGRVKIKMEFIDNKLRRYTTFSKRKTGIMKKAYELSTLTGTQVMLLVASETGHVYTFATRKLQPMITSEAGKALIQTCLNSPDPPSGPGSSGPDQRMSATGFEEVDLSYTVADDIENKDALALCQAYYMGAASGAMAPGGASSPSESGQSSGACSPTPPPPAPPITSHVTSSNVTTTSSSRGQHKPPRTISMHMPSTQAFTTTILTGGNLQLGQSNASGGQTVYRLSSNNLLSIPGGGQGSTGAGSPTVLSVVPSNGSSGVVSGGLVYQTAQGVMYHAPAPNTTTTLPEGVILNLGQDAGANGQQYITIPVVTQKQLVQSRVTSQPPGGGPTNKRSKHHHKSSA